MELADVIRRRRMVRNYLPEPIDREVLERIVDLARRVPSAGFSQGHSFVVVTDQETRRAIARLADEDEYTAAGFDPWISRAPAHIVVCVEEEAYHRRYREPDKIRNDGTEIDWPIPYWWVDVGGALMVTLLAAVDAGLAAGFLGTHRLQGLQVLLGIPDAVTPIGIVTIGRPAPDRRSPSLARGWRPAAEMIHWERW